MEVPFLHSTCHDCVVRMSSCPSFRTERYVGMTGADFDIDVPTWQCSAWSFTY